MTGSDPQNNLQIAIACLSAFASLASHVLSRRGHQACRSFACVTSL